MKLGIDLSEHNGNIDFNKVKNAGVEFVILRVGWIGNKENHTIDKKFEEYYVGAKAVGLKIGGFVFNYCNNENTIISGIKWVKKILNNRHLDYPLFLDMENDDTQEVKLSTYGKETLTKISKKFCESFSNYQTGIYANKDWFTNYLDINTLKNFKIWLAEWNGKENHTANFKVNLWQYTSSGKVDGISGNVDMNYCLECEENTEEITGETNKGGEFEVAKKWKNGSTKEDVFADVKLTTKIGTIFPRGEADCLQIIDGKYLVCYNVYSGNNIVNKKTGFVKYNGGL